MEDSAEQGFRQLSDLHAAGSYPELRAAAEEFLQRHPEHGRARKLLGYACLLIGEPEAAIDALSLAADQVSDPAEVLDLLGCACNMLGRHGEASASFEKSLASDPTRAATWANLGKNRDDMGERTAAVDAYRRALAIDPDLVIVLSNVGAILTEIGDPNEALDLLDRAVALAPENIWVNMHRGNALKKLDRIAEAIEAYDNALRQDRNLFQGWVNLADVLQLSGDTVQALGAAEYAYELNPESPEVLNTLGTLLAASGRHREAEGVLRRAVAMRPEDATFWLNLGHASAALEDMMSCYQQALVLRPDFDQALSPLLFCRNYLASTTLASMFDEASQYGRMLARRIEPMRQWDNDRSPERPLRIGIVSADFCAHPVSYFLESTLMAFSDKPHSWVAYSTVEKEDSTTGRFREHFGQWRDCLAMADDVLAARIVEDGIDILIDLAGHSAGHRLPVFARKPAPVQLSWLGYFATTGLTTIDWIVADPWYIQPGEERYFTERVWRLPESRFCFMPPRLEAEIPTRLRAIDEPPLFACFNTLIKLNDDVLRLWSRVMAAVPDARLLIKAKQLDDEVSRQALTARLSAHGIAPDRVILEGRSPRAEYLETYHRIDFCLETFPFTGGTTTAEALWMGVPVLTLRGETMIARQGESMLRNIGMADWVAADGDEYVQKAVRFSRDHELLSRLRRTLRDRGAASPLGNPVWFANQFESALRGMWRQYCKERPAPTLSAGT